MKSSLIDWRKKNLLGWRNCIADLGGSGSFILFYLFPGGGESRLDVYIQ